MVMGPTHAMSGAAVWLLAAPTIAELSGHSLDPGALAISTAVAAGSALLPDLDSPGSTVARSFGWPSQVLAATVNRTSLLVYRLTRSSTDSNRDGGHRTLTHILAFTIALACLAGWLSQRYGPPAVAATLFITVGLGVRGLLSDWARRNGWLITTAASAATTWAAWSLLPAAAYWWLGTAVGAGALIHVAGDMITRAGCPVLWPLPLGSRRWRQVGVPGPMRIRAGGVLERSLLLPALTVTVCVLSWQTYSPLIYGQLNRS